MMKNIIYLMLAFLPLLSCKTEEDEVNPPATDNKQETSALEEVSYPLNSPEDLEILTAEIDNSRYVLPGEASHGTSEYYTLRAELSKQLIQEKDFNIIAVEGDWPDIYRLNEYIKGSAVYGTSAVEVLQRMDRWPTWMWANEEVAEFAEWLWAYNQGKPESEQVSFYGLDVYSLWDSMDEVIRYLEATDPAGAEEARNAYVCLAPFGPDEWAYAQAKGKETDCSGELANVLEIVQQQVNAAPE